MLKIKALYHLSYVAEPTCIVLVDICLLAPVSVTAKVLSDLIHVFKALLLIISPDLGLLIHEVGEYLLHYMLEFGEIKDQSYKVLLSSSLVRGVFHNLTELAILAIFMKH